MAYTPKPMSSISDLDGLRRYVEEELRSIALAASEQIAIDLRPVFREPDHVREGMIVFADGTSWNPGGGKGVYVYSGGAWVKL